MKCQLYSTVYCNRNSNKNTISGTTSKSQGAYSVRGLQIQNRLKEIKILIKQKKESYGINEIRRELLFLKEKLTNNSNNFSKFYNIPIKISQIDSYLSKIGETSRTDSLTNIKSNEAQTDEKYESKTGS